MKDELGEQYKEYERASELVLPPKLPVILRLDGNSFSRFTQNNFTKPFDPDFDTAMDAAALSVLKYCAGACMAFVQSDEITIVLRNDQKENTDPFLANRTQKLTSLTAALASVTFGRKLAEMGYEIPPAIFDCRAFTVPSAEEALGVVSWRQEDCFRNAISTALYHTMRQASGRKTAHRWMHGKAVRDYIPKLEELGITMDDLGPLRLRGRVFYRVERELRLADIMEPDKFEKLLAQGRFPSRDHTVVRPRWEIHPDPPRFNTEEGRSFALTQLGIVT